MEALEFEGWLDSFQELGVSVVGCSPDPLEAQQSFATRQTLRFPLLADPDGKICRAYGVLPEGGGFVTRGTVVIGTDGTITLAYPQARVRGHAEQVLNDLRTELA
ncbi:MAG TPA: peroxiredoxin [Actinomycetota bacterium]|nr:peroxiredoxin [Actinomycetota bacterium]